MREHRRQRRRARRHPRPRPPHRPPRNAARTRLRRRLPAQGPPRLHTRADDPGAGEAVGILREAGAVNARRRQRVIDLAREELGTDLRGKRITVWGTAFKPETDDIRDSPALAVAQALHDLGATVTVTDPKALDNARKLHPCRRTPVSAPPSTEIRAPAGRLCASHIIPRAWRWQGDEPPG
ncbi:UDP binding domain-containing protein [Streptomyces sp. NPDC051907]|uniref:UDP binding domain-containing protein n=1 Tax=Streptomyces sp. NPDC051907 TaxID=3155284 RepID=UPI00343C76F6